VQVDPPGLEPTSLHQGPGFAVGPGGELYVSWSSRKPDPGDNHFASDLRLSRSLDGGQAFEAPLRVNDDRPLSHSFEGMAVAGDGSVLVAWIDAAQEGAPPGTRVARVVERGSRVESVQTLGASTCVCCRVHVSAGGGGRAAVLWREELPGSVRDMMLALSGDAGRSFAPARLVHADGWRFEGCPHRGGAAGFDAAGHLAVAWYTEGAGRPSLRLASAEGEGVFSAPRELQAGADTIPDRVALALQPDGTGVVAWETLIAVRREIRARALLEGGRVLGPVQEIPLRGKARGPALAAAPDGGFWLAFHEEAFPATRTVVQELSVAP
jgi:hypothetical protein